MSSATSSILNALSVAEICLASSSTLFPTKNQYPFHSFPSKPIKLVHLSSSFSSWVSFRHKSSPFRIVPLVAQTSDWAQQEEGETQNTEGLTWESQGEEGADAGVDTVASSEDDDGLIGGVDDGDDNAEEAVLEGSEGGFYPEPPEDAKLFVGNLPYDVDSEKLAQIFNEAGVVEIAEVIYNRETDQSRGFGFITMSTVEEAEKAVEMFNRYDINGRLLTVNKAAPRGSPPQRVAREPSFRIYVGNLAWQVDDACLEQIFSEHGKVINARVVCDRETGRSRGFGFVTMSNETELNDAIAALDGQSLDGRAIRVNVAEERPKRSFF